MIAEDMQLVNISDDPKGDEHCRYRVNVYNLKYTYTHSYFLLWQLYTYINARKRPHFENYNNSELFVIRFFADHFWDHLRGDSFIIPRSIYPRNDIPKNMHY